MSIVEDLSELLGAVNVLTGKDAAAYSHDWASKYHWTPLAVVRPGSTEEVSRVLAMANANGTAVVPVAGNTGVSAGTYAEGALMLSLDRMNQIEEINPTARTARVQAGVIVETLHQTVRDQGLVFPLLFGAQGSAQVGGALATNAGGSNVLRFGNVRALCLGIECVLADGRVMDLMNALHKDNSGYDLRDLIVGSEGTLAVITRAVLKLVPAPSAYATAMLATPTLEDGLAVLHRIQAETGNAVEAFEFLPEHYIARHMERFADAREPFDKRHEINILLEVAATSDAQGQADATGAVPLVAQVEGFLAELMEKGQIADAVIAKSETQRVEMWARRDAAAELALADKPNIGNDVALPVDQVGAFLEDAGARLVKVDPEVDIFWVCHLGDGNVHYTLRPSRDDAGLMDRLMETVEDVVQDLGGSFSAEHGVGLTKRPSMARRKDPVALAVMQSIKAALDPKGILNPGKVLPDQ